MAQSSENLAPHSSDNVAKVNIIVFGRGEAKIGVAQAASEGTIAGADLLIRPLMRTAELLEAVPGMIAAQHSGSGKANQFFLRGFNLDHGSDFALYVDGVPMNLRTHGHGQGYLDVNGLIPEIVAREDFRKGPYRADGGDFALAGAAYMRTINNIESTWISGEAGSYGARRAAAGMTVRGVAGGNVVFVGQAKNYDGPSMQPERLRHLAAFVKYTAPLGAGDIGISYQGYSATWRPTEQIPERIIGTSDCPDVFCSPDPSARGRTVRHIAAAVFDDGPFHASAYGQYYDFRMSSNPVYANPDGSTAQIEQFDNRWTFGSALSWKPADTGWITPQIGAEFRYDDIRNVGVENTNGALPSESLGRFAVSEGSIAGFAQATLTPVFGLRLVGGMRGDLFWYSVRGRDAAAQALGQGNGSRSLWLPKASIAYQTLPWLELYANYGEGFHSNDARGAVAQTPVPLLVKGRGRELGARVQAGGLTFTGTYWWLNVGSELRFIGDANSVEPTGASNRRGYELVAFWRPLSWLAVDANYTASHARYDNGDFIPNAFENAGQIGVALVKPRWEFAVRLRHLGGYPLLEDNSLRDKGSTVVN
ncbi:MAG: TonB-dependent receptor, partial [Novosphingobium sp.]